MPSHDFEATRQPSVVRDQATIADAAQEAALQASIRHQQSRHIVRQMGEPSMIRSRSQGPRGGPRGGPSIDSTRGDSSRGTATRLATDTATSERCAEHTSSEKASSEIFRSRSEGTAIMLPGFITLTGWQVELIRSAMMVAGPLGALFVAAVDAATEFGITLGIGRTVSGGLGAGGSYGAGIVVAPHNQIFVYESVSAALGGIASISDTLTVTIVDGGVDRFRGECIAVTLAGGTGLVVGGSVLLTMDRKFLGVTLQAGFALGMPLEIYKEVQRTWVDGNRLVRPRNEQLEDDLSKDSEVDQSERD